MPLIQRPLWLVPCMLVLAACGVRARLPVAAGFGPDPALPPPDSALIPTVNIAPAKGWPPGAKPTAAPGLVVQAFARGLDHPRWLYVLPDGDVLVAETNAPPRPQDATGLKGWAMRRIQKRAGAGVPSADRITLLRDANGDGIAETRDVLLDHLHSPFGMALVGDALYVADTDALLRFPYRNGATRIDAAGSKVADLPAGPINHHWTKNVVASPDGRRLYVTVGSNSNAGENGLSVERDRARILEIDRASGATRVYATGLRNPVGMAWQPQSGALWVAVNERDELGSDLVPDYMTAVREGAFYGWPYSYYGAHVDERVKPQDPARVARAVVPDYALGPHTASLGLAFYDAALMPQFRDGAFVGQHGSWNRKPLSGYRVIFVPFADGTPAGPPQDVLTGFVDKDGNAQGRPVGVAVARDGALLVADDVGNTIWRVAPAHPRGGGQPTGRNHKPVD
ncbi:Glucose/arabinose dehydrogenase, beta-propeller fold [Frateuria terrea]|uniref:Glucose/arabinose dehydrogenase, beta-propeller fold n=2 Tax=Frateuria terrea TaxID=529704 RepID=A0A1H6QQT2_9GAMM|nr:Glucose/arabinose dehydrogenase, beta-propeller fold [Frateuria terrea]SFP08669.1 Glucose/arabinose dehydrogenase, beta-propeller fold [Frateuria terrea]